VRETHFPALDGDRRFDVAVVGGGITGLTTALLLKRAGKKVAVLSLSPVGRGVTCHTSGHLTACLDRAYGDLVSGFGEEAAAIAARSSAAAIHFIGTLAGELDLDCDYERVPGYQYTESPKDVERLREEAKLVQRLGLEASWTDDVPLPFRTAGAIRFERQAVFHPGKYVGGLARAVHGDGCAVYERTRVIEVEDASPCRVRTDRHTVTAADVLHATHTPLGVVLSLQARLGPYMSYVLSARVSQPVPRGLFWDTGEPYHYTRHDADGMRVIVGGEDHKTGQEEDTPARFSALERWARERFLVETVEHRWSHQVFVPADGLPYIGRVPGSDHAWVATGYAGTGLTFGTVAAMLLADLVAGREHPWANVFRPDRVKLIASAKAVVKENLDVAWHFVADRLAGAASDTLSDVAAGEGKIVEIEGSKAAVYRDESRRIHVLSPVCRHAGCIVAWNAAARTWDCPCHGGRYAPTGEVLAGPPTEGLDSRTRPSGA
jgi:glycine/D-amino acid oxidase-like deaminating enzyme/nitrite reductase/ring-hydroxylating ferredoxin subunit